MDELLHTWRDIKTPEKSRGELSEMVESRLQDHLKSIRKTLRYDMITSLITLSVFIIAAFVLDLRYRWIVMSVLMIYGLLLYIHFQLKYRVFQLRKLNNTPLILFVELQIRSIRRYQNTYLTVIPISTAILAGSFCLAYSTMDYWIVLSISFMTGLASFIAVRLVWQWFYGSYSKKVAALSLLVSRLKEI
jgi:hypothetical protein